MKFNHTVRAASCLHWNLPSRVHCHLASHMSLKLGLACGNVPRILSGLWQWCLTLKLHSGTLFERVPACSVRGLRAKSAPASSAAVIGGGPAQRLPPVRSESPHGPYGMHTNYSALRAACSCHTNRHSATCTSGFNPGCHANSWYWTEANSKSSVFVFTSKVGRITNINSLPHLLWEC